MIHIVEWGTHWLSHYVEVANVPGIASHRVDRLRIIFSRLLRYDLPSVGVQIIPSAGGVRI